MATSSTGALRLLLQFHRAENSDNPYAFRVEPQDYLLPTAGGSSPRARFDWTAAMLADLEAVRRPGRTPEVVQRVGDKLHRFVLFAGWADYQVQIAEAAAVGRRIYLTIRSSAAELYALPWELLTLASGQFVGELDGLLLRFEWPDTKSTPELPRPRPAGGRILVAWSGATVPAREQLAAISTACAAGFLPFQPSAVPGALPGGADELANASLKGILQTLTAAQQAGNPIAVLHLLCHGAPIGNSFGLALSGDSGPVVVDPAQLRRLAPFAAMVRLVVLSACDSANPGELGNRLGSAAQELHRCGFAAVIASRFPLSAVGSITLTQTFYSQLLAGPASLETAFLAARQKLLESEAGQPLEKRQLDWASLQLYARHDDGDDTRPVVFRPFQGLLAFPPEQRRFFFGREEERKEVLEELQQLVKEGRPRFQIVEGPSGVGKSSLVLAGVVPELAQRGWPWTQLRPGSNPLGNLEVALRELEAARNPPTAERLPAGSPRQLLVVDQLEEIFTHVPEERRADRDRFVQKLWELASQPDGLLSIVTTMRIDYRGQCAEVRLLPATASQDERRLDSLFRKDQSLHNTYVQQMTRGNLQKVIEEPARLVGLELENGLAMAILEAAGKEPGALSLIQHALDQLWQRRTDRILTTAAYRELGGLTGALNRHADEVMRSFTAEDREEARLLLVALVARPGEHAPYTRCAVRLSALRPAAESPERERFDRVLAKLTTENLVVVHELSLEQQALDDPAGQDPQDPLDPLDARDTRDAEDAEDTQDSEDTGAALVEVAHEALIRTWAQLGSWVRHAHVALPMRQQLESWIEEWRKNPQALLTPVRLASAEQFAKHSPERLASKALALMQASRDAIALAERHAAAESRRLEEFAQRGHDRMRLAAARAAADNPTVQAVILREIERPGDVFRGQLGLVLGILHQPIAAAVLGIADLGIVCAAASPNGSRVAAGCDDHSVRIWRSDGTGEPIVLRGHKGSVYSVAFSAGGSRIVTASSDRTARVWRSDGSSSAVIKGHSASVTSAFFSPDGTRVVTASEDRTARVWRADGTGELMVLRGHKDVVRSASFSADGRFIVTASNDRTAQIWQASGTGAPVILRGHENAIHGASFSPDGSRVATVSSDSTVRIWNSDGSGKPVVFRGHESPANTAAFSPDGRYVVTASDDGTAQVWRADGTDEVAILRGHTGSVNSAYFSSDGSRVVTAGDDLSARVWRASGTGAPLVLRGHQNRVRTAAFFRDGTRILTQSEDGTARVFRLDSLPSSLTLRGHTGPVRFAAFSPDKNLLITASDDDAAWLWRTDGDGQPVQFRGHKERVIHAAVSANSARVLTLSADGVARLFATDGTGTAAELSGPEGTVTAAAFSPDGEHVLTAATDGIARLYRSEGPREPRLLRGHSGALTAACFSPDGRLVLTASEDGTARLFRLDATQDCVVLHGHSGALTAAAFSPDGSRVVTTAIDGTARVYRLGGPSDNPLAGPLDSVVLRSHVNAAAAAAMSQDGVPALNLSVDRLRRTASGYAPSSLVPTGDSLSALRAAAFSGDGTQVLLGSDSGQLLVYRIDRPEEFAIVRDAPQDENAGARSLLVDAAFLPDQPSLVYRSQSGRAVLVRRLDRLSEPAVLTKQDQPIGCIAVSADGTYLAAATGHEVSLWAFSPEELRKQLWRASSYCLPTEERTERLGESEEEALAGYTAAREQVRARRG